MLTQYRYATAIFEHRSDAKKAYPYKINGAVLFTKQDRLCYNYVDKTFRCPSDAPEAADGYGNDIGGIA